MRCWRIRPELRDVGDENRSGIVHRLDKDTSGLIVVAKTESARENLQRQFKSRSVAKVYVALVEGHLAPPQGLIDVPIGRDKRQRKRMAAAPTAAPRAPRSRPSSSSTRARSTIRWSR